MSFAFAFGFRLAVGLGPARFRLAPEEAERFELDRDEAGDFLAVLAAGEGELPRRPVAWVRDCPGEGFRKMPRGDFEPFGDADRDGDLDVLVELPCWLIVPSATKARLR